jgi:tRNA-specific 2-thiouridylase
LGIELLVLDCSHAFRERVLSSFRTDYEQGRTPNPCVLCNSLLKFDMIQHLVREAGVVFDLFATGHYARIIHSPEGRLLGRARERAKDQSYFLYRLNPAQLDHTLFPLGEMTKEHVRSEAVAAGLAVAEKEESQDFYSGDYRDLLKHLDTASGSGPIVDTAGNVLGSHEGIHHFTVGQRKGLGLCSAQPLYVIEIDASRNAVVVGHRAQRCKQWLFADTLNLFVSADALPQSLDAQIRSGHAAASCCVKYSAGGIEVTFDEPQENIAPGQSVVLYHNDLVLGGGIIREAR